MRGRGVVVCVLGVLVMLMLVVTAGPASAGIDSWTTTGPEGGLVSAVLGNPQVPGTAWAATLDGLYGTTDFAATWQRIGAGLPLPGVGTAVGLPIFALTRDAATNTLYAAIGATVYDSVDGGADFTAAGTLPGLAATDTVYALRLEAPTTIWAATTAGVWESTNAGTTWAKRSQGLPAGDEVHAFLVTDLVGSPLLAGTEHGVYTSTNGGASWVPFTDGLPATAHVESLGLHPDGTLYAAGDFGVFTRIDGAPQWMDESSGLPMGTDVRALVVRSFANGSTHVLAGTESGVYEAVSANMPAILSFHGFNSGLPSDGSVFSIAWPQGDATYVGADGGVFKYDYSPAVQSWRLSETGIRSTRVFGALAADPSNPTVYAGTGQNGQGLFRSTDGGATWSQTTLGNGVLLTISSAVGADHAVYLGTLGASVVASIDGGATFHPASNGLPNGEIVALAASPAAAQTVLASDLGVGTYRTVDGGANWLPVGAGLPSGAAFDLAYSRADANVVYAAAKSFGVYRSTDAGATFALASGGLPASGADGMVPDPANPLVAYTVSDGSLWRTADGGASWQRGAALGLTGDVLLVGDPSTPGVLYAGSHDGVVERTIDGGSSLTSLGAVGGAITALALAPGGGTLYAGTYGSSVRQWTSAADLRLAATGPKYGGPGKTVTVGFDVSRVGGSDPATGVRVEVSVPAGASVVPSAGCLATSAGASCPLGLIADGAAHHVALELTLPTVKGAAVTSATVVEGPLDPTPADDAASASTLVDTSAPTGVSFTKLPRFSASTTITLKGAGTDKESGLASWALSVRQAARGKALPSKRSSDGTLTPNKKRSLKLPAGATDCFRVTATNGAGVVSKASAEQCTAIPIDDAALKRHGTWTKTHLRGALGSAYRSASSPSATLTQTGLDTRRLAISVDQCPSCGHLDVLFNGKRIAHLTTHASKTRLALLTLPAFKKTTKGTVILRPAGDGPIRIDALGASEV